MLLSVLAALLFTLFGVALWRIDLVRQLDWGGRIAIAFAGGIVIGGLVMYAESLAGMAWSRWSLGIPLLLGLCGATGAPPVVGGRGGRRSPWWIALLIIFALAIYGTWSARMTCGDLLYFWGPKAVHFFQARSIDVEFLRFPHYYLMHPDYPPLQPLVYVWSAIATGDFSLWGAVMLAPVYLIATMLAFRSFAALRIGNANAYAALLAALLTFGFTAGRAAGGADPMLLMFEVIALSALTFGEGRGAVVIASIALAGAALTKVEGAAFVVAVVIALIVVQRRVLAALAAAVPAALLLGSWIWFAKANGLLDSYGRADKPLRTEKLGYVLYMAGWHASYRVMYLPWIASLAPLAVGRNFRRAAFPLLVGIISLGYTVFFYLHEPDPLWWIKASAERVLLTTLVSFAVASAAASD